MPSELMMIFVGQFGVQSSNAMWELLCLEHCVGPDGMQTVEDDQQINSDVFFQRVNNGKLMPRCILIDAETSVIDEVKNGAYRELFNPEHMLSGCEDSASNFARGSFLCGGQAIKPFRKCVRKLTDQVDHLDGIIMVNSMSGGAGSGMGALFMQQLLLDYPKTPRMQFCLFPSQVMSTSVVEPYNSIFHSHTTIETCDLTVIMDNESLYAMCRDLIQINAPVYNDLNRLIGLMTTSSTATMRFFNSLSSGMKELYTNLIPYPRIHHCIVRQAPFSHISRVTYENRTTEEITRNVFNKSYQTLKCDLAKGRFISVVLNYRGLVTPVELSMILQRIKTKCNLTFVDWAPTGFKLGMNTSLPAFTPDYQLAASDKIVTMLANTTALRNTWLNINRKFDLLYCKRSFIWWYINEGIEETEFQESRIDMQLLVEDYEEIAMTENEIMAEFDNKPQRKSRSFSVRFDPNAAGQDQTEDEMQENQSQFDMGIKMTPFQTNSGDGPDLF